MDPLSGEATGLQPGLFSPATFLSLSPELTAPLPMCAVPFRDTGVFDHVPREGHQALLLARDGAAKQRGHCDICQ